MSTLFTARSTIVTAFVAVGLLAGCTSDTVSVTPAPAPQFSRPPGSFYALYTGDKRPALDVVAASGFYSSSQNLFVVTATMAGPVAVGAPNYYVWGFDRGGATNAPFPAEPNVKFNAVLVVTVNAGGSTSAVVNLIPGGPQPQVPTITTNGAQITVTFSGNSLPTTGSAPAAYTWNLWSRNALGGAPGAQIASFAPENAELPFIQAQ